MAKKEDAGGIREVYLNAFSEDERQLVADLAVGLQAGESVPPTFSLVAERGCEIVGHLGLSPVWEKGKRDLLGYILAPLAVHPDCQRKGIGSGLIDEVIATLLEDVSGILLVYGDPEYYGRFGFRLEVAEVYLPPYPIEHPFGWQGLRLGEGALRKEPVSIECVPSLSVRELW